MEHFPAPLSAVESAAFVDRPPDRADLARAMVAQSEQAFLALAREMRTDGMDSVFLVSDPSQKWRLAANFSLYLLPFLAGALLAVQSAKGLANFKLSRTLPRKTIGFCSTNPTARLTDSTE